MFVYDGIGERWRFQVATNEDEKSDTTNEKMGFVVSHLRKGRSWSWSLCRNIVARPPARLPALPGRMCSLAWTGRAPVLGFFWLSLAGPCAFLLQCRVKLKRLGSSGNLLRLEDGFCGGLMQHLMARAGPPVVQQQVASEPVVAAGSRRRCRTTRPPVLEMVVVVERRIVDVAATR